jgi:hypothetical protein
VSLCRGLIDVCTTGYVHEWHLGTTEKTSPGSLSVTTYGNPCPPLVDMLQSYAYLI